MPSHHSRILAAAILGAVWIGVPGVATQARAGGLKHHQKFRVVQGYILQPAAAAPVMMHVAAAPVQVVHAPVAAPQAAPQAPVAAPQAAPQAAPKSAPAAQAPVAAPQAQAPVAMAPTVQLVSAPVTTYALQAVQAAPAQVLSAPVQAVQVMQAAPVQAVQVMQAAPVQAATYQLAAPAVAAPMQAATPVQLLLPKHHFLKGW